MRELLLIIPILLLLFACSSDDEPKFFTAELTSEIDSLLTGIMTTENLPSIAVSIEVDGEIYNYCAGIEDLETDNERQLDSQFRIASITKTFTATLIMMLADEGLLHTEDYLMHYLPDFPNAEYITLKDLLMMRSGIKDYADADFLELIYAQPFIEFEQDSLIAISAALEDEFTAPDENTVYCNANYTILGKVIEIVTGNNLQTEYHNRIIEPFGLTHTYYPLQGDYELPGSLHGYCWEEDHFIDYTELNPLWAGAAGALISDIADLRTYVRWMFYGFNMNPAIQQERLQTITMQGAPDWFQYGEGIAKLGGFYGHNGTIFGFCTDMWYQPESDATVIVSVNRLDLDDHSQATDIFLQLSRIVFPEYVSW
ncbi:MAG: beta-lactamase family protein [Candidatus Cloacimonetes bacterium]|nr:beta-lactamase family protein [Candidatus Cloacimonadota bacterium]